MVELVGERGAVVGGFEKTAAGGGDPVRARVGIHDGEIRDATAHVGRADGTPRNLLHPVRAELDDAGQVCVAFAGFGQRACDLLDVRDGCLGLGATAGDGIRLLAGCGRSESRKDGNGEQAGGFWR